MSKTRSALGAFILIGAGLTGCGGSGANTVETAGPEPTIAMESRVESQIERSAMRERALKILTDASFSDTALLRAHALEGLESAPQRAETAARAGLQDQNPGVRFVATMVVGHLQLKSSAAAVRPLLNDPDPRVRAGAMYAMYRTGEQVDLSPLARMLKSGDSRVRSQAAGVLGELGRPSAAGLLEEALESGPAGDSAYDRLFRLEVALAMARIGRPEGLDHIRAALYPKVREAVEASVLAARMLGELKDRDSARQLVVLVEQDVPDTSNYERLTDPGQGYIYPPELRLAAAQALAEMGYPDGLFVADTYRSVGDPLVRSQVATLYGALGDPISLGRLREMLDDESEYVRIAAAAAVLKAVRS